MSDYRWNPTDMRRFVEAFAESGSVTAACASVGKSRQSAYALSRRPEGAMFRFGWEAARRLARDVIGDLVLERVIDGVTIETEKLADGRTRRTSPDRALSLAVLTRLDHQINRNVGEMDALLEAICSNFESFLILLEAGGTGEDLHKWFDEIDFSARSIRCQLGLKSANSRNWMEYKSMDGAPESPVKWRGIPHLAATGANGRPAAEAWPPF